MGENPYLSQCYKDRLEAGVKLMAGWQPIETAPRDGTSILIGWSEAALEDKGFSDDDWYVQATFWAYDEHVRSTPGWFGTRDDCPPSHWMPAPPRPE